MLHSPGSRRTARSKGTRAARSSPDSASASPSNWSPSLDQGIQVRARSAAAAACSGRSAASASSASPAALLPTCTTRATRSARPTRSASGEAPARRQRQPGPRRVEDEQHRGTGQRDQRQQGDLPVPVDGRVDDECCQDADGDRRARVAPDARHRSEGRQEDEQEEHEPDRTELRQRLEIEVVRIPRLVRHGPLAEPRAGERSGTLAEQRMALDHPSARPSSRRSDRCRTLTEAGGRAGGGASEARRRMLPVPGRRSLPGHPRARQQQRPPRTTAAAATTATTRRTRSERRTRGPTSAAATCSRTASAASPTSSHANR